jgi:diguanylate cyclase (GGDEF)-like protein
MVWFVALVAILNLGLGYALAVYTGAGRKYSAASADELDSSPYAIAHVEEPVDEPLADQSSESFPAEGDDEPGMPDTTAEGDAAGVSKIPLADGVDPTTGLTTREHIEQQLANMMLAHADLQPMTVALAEIEQAAGGTEGVDDRLLRGVAETVRELLAAVQTAGRYSDQQFLLLLPRDDIQHATQRTEQFRQRVEATQFVFDGQQIQATVTCALAQVSASHTATNLLEFLEETLEEAKRYGGNRTFMHDGTSPTPVVPPELNIAPQTCAI